MDKNTSSNELADLKAKLAVYQQWHNETIMNQSYADNEIDLKELLKIIWSGKWQIFLISAFFAVASALYAISLPNVYKSEVLLMPNNQDSQQGSLGGLAGQFGGLASLEGINLGGGGTDKTGYAIEVLKSRSFLYEFIAKNQLKAKLFATLSWNRETNTFNYDNEIYDDKSDKWVRAVKAPFEAEPSYFEVYKKFIKENLKVSQDKETGMVRVSVTHYSPNLAKGLVDKLVYTLNEEIKQQDMEEATKSISYLNKELEQTRVSGMQSLFYQLIEQQQQKLMLTKVRSDYVLKIVDQAVVAEEKSKPNRAIITLIGCFLGGLIGLFSIFVGKFRATKN